jgi:hypothetical protein
MVSVVVVVDPPRPTTKAMIPTMTMPAITMSQIVVFEESSDEVEVSLLVSPPDAAWVVSGALVVVSGAFVVVGASVESVPESLPESPPDAAVVVTRLPPVPLSPLQPAARPMVATTRTAASTNRID